ncbi:MAG TPA: Fic family protein, partial [Chthoniobacteraceae bacterium]|nr:Fic family protein [Chthoniobacteraceae bacterium]
AAAKYATAGRVIRSVELPRKHREVLLKSGFLTEIIKGWYLFARPPEGARDTTVWQGAFWEFASSYLGDRFGEDYCLSPEGSLDLAVDATQIPKQLIVMTRGGGTGTVELPNQTSILTYSTPKNLPQRERRLGVLTMPLAVALCRVGPRYFESSPLNAELALRTAHVSEVSRVLLELSAVAAANRIAGAYQRMGLPKEADQIVGDMTAAGFDVVPTNPFPEAKTFLSASEIIRSPHIGRIKALWAEMRGPTIEAFPEAEQPSPTSAAFFERLEDIYVHDAYNSLSIEGYQVSPELIERIRRGDWNPDNPRDAPEKDAMSAKGYLEAFNAVKKSIADIFAGSSPGDVVDRQLQNWYRALFSPSVAVGIVSPASLAGYRAGPVYIRGSQHVPPPREAVPDLMETLFGLLKTEPSAAVRAVLGHFIFVFIHPYMDGNGRIGRFLMNAMFASGGYPWTIVRLSERQRYMHALEKASVDTDIREFATFLGAEMKIVWRR